MLFRAVAHENCFLILNEFLQFYLRMRIQFKYCHQKCSVYSPRDLVRYAGIDAPIDPLNSMLLMKLEFYKG